MPPHVPPAHAERADQPAVEDPAGLQRGQGEELAGIVPCSSGRSTTNIISLAPAMAASAQ